MDKELTKKSSKVINDKGEVYKTVEEYLSLKNKSVNDWIMVSEFIDNSISSFENEYGEDPSNWDKKLEITLGYYIEDDSLVDTYVNKEPCKYYKDVSFYILDNAFGIDFDDLRPALIHGHANLSSKSTKNRFGKGLKQAIFHFGMDVEVFTSSKTGNSKVSLEFSKCKSPETETIKIVPFKWDKSKGTNNITNFGTKIIVKSIYDKKIISKFPKATLNNFLESLSGRYGKYIEAKQLDITIKASGKKIRGVFDPRKVSTPLIEREKFHAPIKSLMDLKYWGEDKQDAINAFVSSFSKKIRKTAEKEKEQMKGNERKIDVDVALETLRKFEDMVSLENWEKEINWSQNFKLPTDKYSNPFFTIKFFAINAKHPGNTGYPAWSGITVYEGVRAINHGPSLDSQGTYKRKWFKKADHYTGATDNIFCGFFDLLDLDTKRRFVTEDKSDFKIDDIQDDLDTFIFSVWWCFNIIIMKGRTDAQISEFNVKKAEETVRENLSYEKDNINYVDGPIKLEKIKNPNGNESDYGLSLSCTNVKTLEITKVNEKWGYKIYPDFSNENKEAVRNSKIISNVRFLTENNGFRTLELLYYPHSNIIKLASSYLNKEENIYIPMLSSFCYAMIDLRIKWEQDQIKNKNQSCSNDEEPTDIITSVF